MKNNGLFFSVSIGMLVFLTACATSMAPVKLNNTLSALTTSKSVSKVAGERTAQGDRCTCLVKGRKYTAPMGLSLRKDVKNGAKGIDEWVELDGGNAYALVNYEWVSVDNSSSTQLHVEFDTMLCE